MPWSVFLSLSLPVWRSYLDFNDVCEVVRRWDGGRYWKEETGGKQQQRNNLNCFDSVNSKGICCNFRLKVFLGTRIPRCTVIPGGSTCTAENVAWIVLRVMVIFEHFPISILSPSAPRKYSTSWSKNFTPWISGIYPKPGIKGACAHLWRCSW